MQPSYIQITWQAVASACAFVTMVCAGLGLFVRLSVKAAINDALTDLMTKLQAESVAVEHRLTRLEAAAALNKVRVASGIEA